MPTDLPAMDQEEGFAIVQTRQNPHVHRSNPYSGVGDFLSNVSYLMEHSHTVDMTYITNTATAIEVINYDKAHNIETRFSSEDSSRSNVVDILSIYSTVDKIDANRIGRFMAWLAANIETHFHNNTGCAIANAYCALEAGATYIDMSVLGITPLGRLMAHMIVTDRECIMNNYKLEKLKDIEGLVAQAVEANTPFDNYVAGFCASTHRAGIRAKGNPKKPLDL